MDHAREEIKARLKTAWAAQLRLDHRSLLRRLDRRPPAPGGAGPRPGPGPPVSFDLFDGGQAWGSWRPAARVIAINTELITARPWDVVLGILAHETAHQLVTDHHQGVGESDHGPAFQRFCDLLKLHPVYRRAGVDLAADGLPPSVFTDPDLEVPSHPILEKIKKLLALSNSPEPHEAALALSMASRLMAKHNIESRELDAAAGAAGGPGPYRRWRHGLGRTRIRPEDFLYTAILERHFFVRPIVTWQFDPASLKTFRAIELLGRPVNLHMARHVLLFLIERVETLWLANKRRLAELGEMGLGARNTFVVRMLQAFQLKLQQSEAASAEGRSAPAPSAELILRSDAGLADFIKECYPRLSTTRSSGGANSPASARAGYEAGRSLSIRPPVANRSPGGGRPGQPDRVGAPGGGHPGGGRPERLDWSGEP
jgi:hypothetical protein